MKRIVLDQKRPRKPGLNIQADIPRMMRLLPFAIAVFLSSVVCLVPNLDTENFVRNQPSQSDLVGSYAPIESSQQLIQEEGGYDPADIFVKLAADGRFEITKMPDWWWHSFGEPSGGFGSGSGEWQVVAHQQWWDVQFNFDEGNIPMVTSVPIAGGGAPYRLCFYVGDPDSGKVMIFERVNP